MTILKKSQLPPEAYEALKALQYQADIANRALKDGFLDKKKLIEAQQVMKDNSAWVSSIISAMGKDNLSVPELNEKWLEKTFCHTEL